MTGCWLIDGHGTFSWDQPLCLISKNYCLHISSEWSLITLPSKVFATFCSYNGKHIRSAVKQNVMRFGKGLSWFLHSFSWDNAGQTDCVYTWWYKTAKACFKLCSEEADSFSLTNLYGEKSTGQVTWCFPKCLALYLPDSLETPQLESSCNWNHCMSNFRIIHTHFQTSVRLTIISGRWDRTRGDVCSCEGFVVILRSAVLCRIQHWFSLSSVQRGWDLHDSPTVTPILWPELVYHSLSFPVYLLYGQYSQQVSTPMKFVCGSRISIEARGYLSINHSKLLLWS